MLIRKIDFRARAQNLLDSADKIFYNRGQEHRENYGFVSADANS